MKNTTNKARTAAEITNDIIKFFAENEDIFNSCIEDLDFYNGYLGDGRYYYMEDIDELYANVEPLELLNRIFYGHDEDTSRGDNYAEFNPTRTFFRYNGYGNLVSTDYRDYSAYLDKYAIDEMSENRAYIDSIENDIELSELFDELEEVEE